LFFFLVHNFRLKGFEEFAQETVKEYDKAIEDLMEITEKIRFQYDFLVSA
jgi:hypothetical protein